MLLITCLGKFLKLTVLTPSSVKGAKPVSTTQDTSEDQRGSSPNYNTRKLRPRFVVSYSSSFINKYLLSYFKQGAGWDSKAIA